MADMSPEDLAFLKKIGQITEEVKPKPTAKKKVSVADIAALAKKIRKPNEAWTSAIKRAAAQMKKA